MFETAMPQHWFRIYYPKDDECKIMKAQGMDVYQTITIGDVKLAIYCVATGNVGGRHGTGPVILQYQPFIKNVNC